MIQISSKKQKPNPDSFGAEKVNNNNNNNKSTDNFLLCKYNANQTLVAAYSRPDA